MTKETNTIGAKIRECRKAMGLSQEALADAFGTTPNYLLLGQSEGAATDAWIEDMLLIMNKISEPVYRDLALKQLKCIAETMRTVVNC